MMSLIVSFCAVFFPRDVLMRSGTELSQFLGVFLPTLALLFNGDQLLKERICSSCSIFFPSRVDPILARLRPLGKETGSPNCHLCNTARKHGGVSIYLTNRCRQPHSRTS